MKKVLPIITHNKYISSVTTFILQHKKLSVVLALAIAAIAFFLWPKPTTPIETVAVEKRTIQETVSGTGSVDSEATVNLNFITSGKLATLNVKKGDHVKAGQVIATLDLRSAQKNLEDDLKDYSKQRNTFEQTKHDKGVQEVVNAPNDTLKRIMENNQYDLEKAVISVELQELAKQSSILTTPIAGVVTRADAKVAGVNVSPTTSFVVSDPESLVFKIDVDESDIGKVSLGQPINVVLDAYPDEEVFVTVTSIDFASHTTSTGGNAYTVESQMPLNTDDRYRIGMNGDAQIILTERKDVFSVPLSSIVDDTYVYVKGKREFEKRKVVLGVQNETVVEVKEGLKEGELVAISPAEVEKKQNIKKSNDSQ